MARLDVALVTALLIVGAAAAQAQAPLTLERIMADPDWIGPPVEHPYFALDGKAVYYSVKRPEATIRDLHRIELADGRDHAVDAAALADLDAAGAVFDGRHLRAAFVRNGDVFVRELSSGRLVQITRSAAEETAPQFSADGRVLQFRAGNDWYEYDFATAVAGPIAQLKAEKNPDDKKPGEMEELQLRLIATLKREHDQREAAKHHAEEQRKADATRAPPPVYLGDDVQIVDSALAPSGHWLLAVTTPKGYEAGRAGKMPKYVTESGYEETEDTRTRVGRAEPAPQTLWLVDLTAHATTKLAYADLPGIKDDPLAAVRAENEKARAARGEKPKDAKSEKGSKEQGKKSEKPESKERPLQVGSMQFNRDGSEVVVQLRSNDNKDRWLASVDFGKKTLKTQHRLTDPAWINWGFNEVGFTPDGRSLWYLSEETGYGHLYVKPLDGRAQALTSGTFEVEKPVLSHDGRWFYVRANAEAPYSYDVYRVPLAGGTLERVTSFKGVSEFALSPDGNQVLVEHSQSYVPMQLAVVPASGGAARELTDTRTADYKALSWQQPEIVAVPSTHVKQPIWSKFYDTKDGAATHSIVLFVHGAGYTQNTHLQFPYYFREQMFHNLLTQRGYLVLDMDYRASQGYGRDWRTAIYRNMGHPELEDLIDGVNWLVKEHHGDPKRVGVYGGSYGGFMTLMALFRAPETFRVGAALRPVTDWTQYNHEYTSNILNPPQVDDIAYRRSSPIEFAENLKGPLLICHGMIDDNVFFQDSVRLYQRLIELHKDDVQLAPYPMDRHAFSHADSWLDEYKRIYRLFETNLRH